MMPSTSCTRFARPALLTGAGLFLVLLALAAPAAPQSSGGAGRDSSESVTPAAVEALVDTLVREQLERRRIAGAVVIVVKDDHVILSRGYGHADIATGRVMTAETLMRIGSITKMLTAVAAMQLVESGRIDLDRDVRDYVDVDIPGSTDRPVTLRRLLSHQTGFEDRRGGVGAPSGARQPLGPFLSRHLPPRLDQDAAALAYANINGSLAAYIIERVSGMQFEAFLADRVFRPLGMTSTTAEQPPAGVLFARVSSGYVTSDQLPTLLSMSNATIYEVGSTGVTASGQDMGRLLLALLGPAPGIVERATIDSMMSGQADLARGNIGLGFYSPLGVNGDPFVGHGGDTGSFHSVFALLPQQRFGLFACVQQRWRSCDDAAPAGVAGSSDGPILSSCACRIQQGAGVWRRWNVRPGAPSGIERVRSARARRTDGGSHRARRTHASSAFLPFGGLALREVVPGLYRGGGFEVSFDRAGGVPVMQIGSPVLRYVRVPWWQSASVLLPLAVFATLLALTAVLGWPIAIALQARHQMDVTGRRLRWTTRAGAAGSDSCRQRGVAGVLGLAARGLSSPSGKNVAMIMLRPLGSRSCSPRSWCGTLGASAYTGRARRGSEADDLCVRTPDPGGRVPPVAHRRHHVRSQCPSPRTTGERDRASLRCPMTPELRPSTTTQVVVVALP